MEMEERRGRKKGEKEEKEVENIFKIYIFSNSSCDIIYLINLIFKFNKFTKPILENSRTKMTNLKH